MTISKFCSGLVPLAAVRGALYAEAIFPGGKSGVGHGTAVAPDFGPRIVQTLEHVAITVGRRIGIRKCSKRQRERGLLMREGDLRGV